MAVLVKTDGTITNLKKKDLTLEAMQIAVDGYIEMITLLQGNDFQYALVNEDGWMKKLPENPVAMRIMGISSQLIQPILGNVIFVKAGEMK
jgi:hypothetical protein